jgi:hypothetical protein
MAEQEIIFSGTLDASWYVTLPKGRNIEDAYNYWIRLDRRLPS